MRYLGREDKGYLGQGWWCVWFDANVSVPEDFWSQNKAPHFDDAREAVLAVWDLFKNNPEFDCGISICHEGSLDASLHFKNRQEVQNAVKEYL